MPYTLSFALYTNQDGALTFFRSHKLLLSSLKWKIGYAEIASNKC